MMPLRIAGFCAEIPPCVQNFIEPNFLCKAYQQKEKEKSITRLNCHKVNLILKEEILRTFIMCSL